MSNQMFNQSNDLSDIKIFIGYADKPNSKKDFNHEVYPSKLGGLPVMLFPLDNNENKIKNFFLCDFCGRKLTFLLQLYTQIESNKNAFHRTLYIFFCLKCFAIRSSFKCIRLQLPEKSEFYDGYKIKDIKKLNSYLPPLTINSLEPEYVIGNEIENEEILKIYMKYINQVNENSSKEDFEELEEDINLNKEDMNIVNNLVKDYYSNLENGNDNDNENEIVESNNTKEKEEDDDFIYQQSNDVVFNLFSKIYKSNPTQIIRYSEDNIKPLWYCKNNIMNNKNLNCTNCGCQRIFEFQIMPYIFLLYKELMNHDIGTIVIYTCNCNIPVSEEYVYVQRTGEGVIDFENNRKVFSELNNKQEEVYEEPKLGFGTSNEPDEDGFYEVNSKKKNKNKIEKIEEDEGEEDWD